MPPRVFYRNSHENAVKLCSLYLTNSLVDQVLALLPKQLLDDTQVSLKIPPGLAHENFLSVLAAKVLSIVIQLHLIRGCQDQTFDEPLQIFCCIGIFGQREGPTSPLSAVFFRLPTRHRAHGITDRLPIPRWRGSVLLQ